jgi:hypothetical protein
MNQEQWFEKMSEKHKFKDKEEALEFLWDCITCREAGELITYNAETDPNIVNTCQKSWDDFWNRCAYNLSNFSLAADSIVINAYGEE